MTLLPIILLTLLDPPAALVPAPSAASVSVTSHGTSYVWDCPEATLVERVPEGLIGFTASGCALSGPNGTVLLPSKDIYLAVPVGVHPVLQITPEGVRSLGSGSVASVEIDDNGNEVFHATDADNLPVEWGRIVETGTFRRAGYALLRLNSVISSSGELLTARRLRVDLSYPDSPAPSPSRSGSGSIFDALFQGHDQVWEASRVRQGPGPFWGLPWYAMGIDTAGIYRVRCSDVPDAEGTPSVSLALFCGRGREMGDQPWENAYVPRSVPLYVEDGGDGTFDQGDSFFFFGRGLSWWEPDSVSMPDHFDHRYDSTNVYWLTWGGEDGSRMDVYNGELTGAPAVPDSFLCRVHLEENNVRTREYTDFPDDWAWIESEGSQDSWHYLTFSAQGALGPGTIRMSLSSSDDKKHRVRVLLNSTQVCDTSWTGTDTIQPVIHVDNIQDGSNSLTLQIVREIGSDVIYLDWFDVFPWTGSDSSPMTQVPMEWLTSTGRQRMDWSPGLDGRMVIMVSGDTLATFIDHDDQNSFEFDFPADWKAREIWIGDRSSLPSPGYIVRESPGRIMGTMNGGECVYVSPEDFIDGIDPLTQRSGVLSVSTDEVYDEFNGGVRDPGAIRAFASAMINDWSPIPSDLVLVGQGHWDPRHFSSSKPCLIDILYYGISDNVSDDAFTIVGGSSVPQIAVSRIGIGNATDLQLVVDKCLEYRSGSSRGDWQTVVLGAADDERSPLTTNDERIHTNEMENVLTNWVPDVLRPQKLYMINYDWNSAWKKPEAREDYIDMWNQGELLSIYLGHGGYDQLADEGLLYLEDIGLLDCGPRLPFAMFMSCNVGHFQNPSLESLAQEIVTSPAGGAILSMGATDVTSPVSNERLTEEILNVLLDDSLDITAGTGVLLGKLNTGYSGNNAQYVLFGDGSLPLALPNENFSLNADTMLSGELCTISGTAPADGVLLVKAWESCQADTYYTFRDNLPIEYLTQPGRLYSGTVLAEPDFTSQIFVPLDSDTGSLARTQFVFLNSEKMGVSGTYPMWLLRGQPSSDSQGPDIELWVDGYRGVDQPQVSGDVCARAVLSDSSGINLLGNTGRQLALYLDGTPDDVSGDFQYYRGSSTSGELMVDLGELEPGAHTIRLRASDGLLNISEEELDFTVSQDNTFGISQVFPYPNPCSQGTSINWTQTAPGRVNISIFTVAGRRVARFGNIEGTAGYNQCWWNCRDADGDEVASGTYIFKVEAASFSSSGSESEETGIIAVVRGS